MFADIIIDITHEKLDKVFQYRIPPELEGVLQVGMEVVVPFGKGNKETHGYVIGFSEKADYDLAKIKEVLCIEENHQEIESKLIALAAWIREYYGGTMIQALKTVLPIKKKERIQHKRKVKLLLNEEEGKKQLDIYLHKNQKARARLLAGLLDQPQQDYELITKKLNVTLSVIRSLEEQGVLEIQEEENFRNPIHYQKKDFGPLTHTPEQQQAIDTFWKDYSQRHYGTYLLYGVTGSGKTEVYIEMISRVVSQGKQAIMLIPEIALTYQTVMRFYARFGNRVSILNSRLSQGERSDQMERVRRGEVDVMIGPRSALFTPFSNLGLIVIDEEHEPTYKSEQVPRYHARETAIHRAQMEQASVGLFPLVMQVMHNNMTDGISKINFYKKRTKELQQTLILCFQEGEESIELEMGWNQYIENKLSIHGETYLVAVKGELSSDVDDNPVLKVEIVYLEEAMRRKLYVTFVKDTSASKLITPEYIEIKWYESPGKALIMEGMESITTEVTKHPIYSRIRENGGIDLLHRLMEQTIEPVIKGKLIITDTH